nr:hypothetical protein GCM10020092_019140 [Actinoplanes digitatis]
MLEQFGLATREWFRAAFAAPTAAQTGAWRSIGAGRNALVVAPTGSGKTLAAFLWSIDRLAHEPTPAEPRRRCRVLYVSPLKALAVDVERNLRGPLTGIRQASGQLGLPPPDITVGMRTGDTPADERRLFSRTPPDILITTPESLFLLLTSAARDSLRGVETVIIDEVHAVAATKRGAHLALSLERLDALLGRPAQRVGLSATVRPIDETARFLGGAADVEIVQPRSAKTIEVSVQVPVEDMTRLDELPDDADDPGAGRHSPSIWPAVEERVLDLISAHRSTIVFTNSRRGAERLCARINELALERAEPGAAPRPARRRRARSAQVMAQSGEAGGAPPVVARAHHGSVSREERKQIEEALKSGRLLGRCRHLQPGAGHRHGRRRPGRPDRGTALGLRRAATHRPRRAPGRRRVPRCRLPEAPRRPRLLRCRRRADERGRDRGAALPAQPARRAGTADRGHDRAGRLAGRRAGRAGPPRGALRGAAGLRPARRPRHAVGALPVDGLRRAAAPPGLGPHDRRADRPPRRPAARRDQRRHDPRPRHVRRLPG